MIDPHKSQQSCYITSFFSLRDNKMDALDALATRRTARQYERDYTIPKDVLEQIINSALRSPSGHNVQDIDLLVVTNRAKLDEVATNLLKAMPENLLKNFNARKTDLGVTNLVTCDASCVVYLVQNERYNKIFNSIDSGIILMAIMVAARRFGLDTMCLGSMLYGDKSQTEALLGIPEGKLAMAIAIGKAKEGHKEGPQQILAKVTYLE
ncbi:nitroreductase family protein [Tritrichomonas foetus]|uniref:Nitroreductase family protein n=1 Tax=Tritrichomonas foetus TaxID=1144522 RepID=A0A1J4KV62_9EUKA|nr:nitroreductase family protein [Tritrichomonas foetus]|eukprot:OHT13590.1 nitroreductase family protein [Tritrichomonas foetus]